MAGKALGQVDAVRAPKDGKPTGEPVTFYLGREQFHDKTKRYFHRFNYNGYLYEVEYGARNTLPREVAEYLKSLGKEGTKIPDVERYDDDRGGRARPQEQFMNPETKEEVPGRFDIELL